MSSAIAWATVDAPWCSSATSTRRTRRSRGRSGWRGPEPGTIYSWVLNNIWDTNFPTEQGGEMSFRYAVTSGKRAAMLRALGTRLGESVSTPLVATVVPSPALGTGDGALGQPVR